MGFFYFCKTICLCDTLCFTTMERCKYISRSLTSDSPLSWSYPNNDSKDIESFCMLKNSVSIRDLLQSRIDLGVVADDVRTVWRTKCSNTIWTRRYNLEIVTLTLYLPIAQYTVVEDKPTIYATNILKRVKLIAWHK